MLNNKPLAFLLFLLMRTAAAADYPPADHGGADLTLGHNDRIWGTHTGIGTFKIPAETSVTVHKYNGLTSDTGRLRVEAETILIEGGLSASTAGYTGGGGGGGGAMASCTSESIYDRTGYPGGEGAYGGTMFNGQKGTDSTGPPYYPGKGGAGGPGDGRWAGNPAGYAGPGINGDVSTSTLVWMGSGASGDKGSDPGCNYSPSFGGNAGGRGGGCIELVASSRIVLGSASDLQANGGVRHAAVLMYLENGGNVEPQMSEADSTQYVSTSFRPGAGGGILLHTTDSSSDITIAPSAQVRTLGGYRNSINGGTVKIFHAGDLVSSGEAIQAGRLYIYSLQLPTSCSDWHLWQ